MLFPPNMDLTRGAAAYGQTHRWPYKVIPYNISAITGKLFFYVNIRFFIIVY